MRTQAINFVSSAASRDWVSRLRTLCSPCHLIERKSAPVYAPHRPER